MISTVTSPLYIAHHTDVSEAPSTVISEQLMRVLQILEHSLIFFKMNISMCVMSICKNEHWCLINIRF